MLTCIAMVLKLRKAADKFHVLAPLQGRVFDEADHFTLLLHEHFTGIEGLDDALIINVVHSLLENKQKLIDRRELAVVDFHQVLFLWKVFYARHFVVEFA